MPRDTGLISAPMFTSRGLLGRDLFRDYARLVDSMFRTPISETISEEFVSPRVDVVETDKSVEVVADIPGIDEKDIKVELRNGVLWLQGERKEEKKTEGRNYHCSERSYGSFERGISLPCEVEKGNIDAMFKDGVLKVVMAKTKEAREEVTPIKIKH